MLSAGLSGCLLSDGGAAAMGAVANAVGFSGGAIIEAELGRLAEADASGVGGLAGAAALIAGAANGNAGRGAVAGAMFSSAGIGGAAGFGAITAVATGVGGTGVVGLFRNGPGPTVLARLPHGELEALLRGYGYEPFWVEGDVPATKAAGEPKK